MGVIKPDLGMEPEEQRWAPATPEDFSWKDTIGSHAETLRAFIQLPNRAGYFSLHACHLRKGTITTVFRRFMLHIADEGKSDFTCQKIYAAKRFQVLDSQRLSVAIGDIRITCSDIQEGYVMECPGQKVSFSLMFAPEVTPLRIGNGRVFTPNAKYQHTAHLVRCKVTGWLVVQGKPIELDGSIGNVDRMYRNINMGDLETSYRALFAHGPRITILSYEARIREKIGGGWLTETYAVLDGQIVDAQTTCTSMGVDLIQKSLPRRNIYYRTCHPVNVGPVQLCMDTTMEGCKMVDALDLGAWLASKLPSHRAANKKHANVVLHYSKDVPVQVNGVADMTSAFLIQRVM